MCMEDIRIMRRTAPQEIIVAVGSAAPVRIVPQDDSIVAVTIDNQGPNDITLSLNPAVTAGNGIRIQPGDPPHRFDLQRDGNAVTRGMYAICTAAQTATVIVWLSFLGDR